MDRLTGADDGRGAFDVRKPVAGAAQADSVTGLHEVEWPAKRRRCVEARLEHEVERGPVECRGAVVTISWNQKSSGPRRWDAAPHHLPA